MHANTKPIFDILSLPNLSPRTLKISEPIQFEAKAKNVKIVIFRPESHSKLRRVTRFS